MRWGIDIGYLFVDMIVKCDCASEGQRNLFSAQL